MPLKFRDDVLVNDRIATGDKAFPRILLGAKAIVTAREHSVVTIIETPGMSTIDLASGRISVAVDKTQMRPGEVVEIKTPNAVAAIRGTIVVAEVASGVSLLSVLRGLADVYQRDPETGNAVGVATPVGVRGERHGQRRRAARAAPTDLDGAGSQARGRLHGPSPGDPTGGHDGD
jgi:hypothetical protein